MEAKKKDEIKMIIVDERFIGTNFGGCHKIKRRAFIEGFDSLIDQLFRSRPQSRKPHHYR